MSIMNLVIVFGKIVSSIGFKFIYDRYMIDSNDKYNHTSIAKCEIMLLNKSIVRIYGYDKIADFMYKDLKYNDYILIEGKLDSNMEIEVKQVKSHV